MGFSRNSLYPPPLLRIPIFRNCSPLEFGEGYELFLEKPILLANFLMCTALTLMKGWKKLPKKLLDGIIC